MAADNDLPTNYDVIVIGTGMTESILAAAASRVGKQVLHIDSNEYYGGLWASFNLENLNKWLVDCEKNENPSSDPDDPDCDVKINNGEDFVLLKNQTSHVSNINQKWHIPKKSYENKVEQWSRKSQTSHEEEDIDVVEDAESNSSKENTTRTHTNSESEKMPSIQFTRNSNWTQEDIMREYRRFNIDLAPKLLFARGSLVELLISSNIARYTEFHAVTRVLTWLDGELNVVPCSRADVFATRHVSVVEKRMLMKLLTGCMDSENLMQEFQGFDSKTFLDYLKSKRLTAHLLHYVLYAIAMGTDDTPCMEGVERTQRFLNSLGRYGNTPFLWPMYGAGELPQAFCRLCAVFGGTYCLQHPAKALLVADDRCVGVVSCGQRLVADHVVMSISQAPSNYLDETPSNGISRAVFITNKSIMPSEKEPLTFLQFPPGPNHPNPITVIEVGPSTHACPKGLFLVHMTCKQSKTAKEDLQEIAENLLTLDEVNPSDYDITTGTQSTQTVKQESNAASSEVAGGKGDETATVRTKPQVFWSMYFNCLETSKSSLSASVPENLHLCSGPDLELDFEFSVQQAEKIFKQMYPDLEFLPRAPDPEEIVIEGDTSEGNDQQEANMFEVDEEDSQATN
ncbi:Rab proteins geranylgeranyltransferase component A 2 [Frankliniella fusca]|uniref:Rab proteins geranylgeranyltransferase component A n=1 Tax=Frankliniella fusca TaxID=407009 RepID=A0AAE1LL39_9NEOP|nr:Rab proteins geranylgeranyltransferase component A 2 [Frankliniella fusca]